MAIALVLVSGISGFLSAIVALFMGHGMWQALLVYWLVGTFAALTLLLCHMTRRALCRITVGASERTVSSNTFAPVKTEAERTLKTVLEPR